MLGLADGSGFDLAHDDAELSVGIRGNLIEPLILDLERGVYILPVDKAIGARMQYSDPEFRENENAAKVLKSKGVKQLVFTRLF